MHSVKLRHKLNNSDCCPLSLWSQLLRVNAIQHGSVVARKPNVIASAVSYLSTTCLQFRVKLTIITTVSSTSISSPQMNVWSHLGKNGLKFFFIPSLASPPLSGLGTRYDLSLVASPPALPYLSPQLPLCLPGTPAEMPTVAIHAAHHWVMILEADNKRRFVLSRKMSRQ